MIKKTITYEDFNGEERTEDFYFNLTQSELVDMELSKHGGMVSMLEKIIAEKDTPQLMIFFKQIIGKAYGEKSPDGRRFMKTPEILANFEDTLAYDKLFMELALDSKQASEFVNGIMPKQVAQADTGQNNQKEVALQRLKEMEQQNKGK